MTTGNTNPNQVIELRSLGSQMVQIPYAKQRKTASNKNPEESDFKSERTKLNFFIQKKKKKNLWSGTQASPQKLILTMGIRYFINSEQKFTEKEEKGTNPTRKILRKIEGERDESEKS